MRIAIITLSFLPVRGGMEFVVHDLATAFHELGHDPFVFAPKVKKANYEEIGHKYHLCRFGMTFKGAYRSGFNRLMLLREFGKVHRREQFDIIHVHSAYIATSYGYDLKRLYGLPMVVTCHGHDIQKIPEVGYGLRLDARRGRVIERNLLRSDLVTSISDSIFSELITIVPESKVAKIPNGIWLNGYTGKFDDAMSWLRNYLKIGNGRIILSVGRNVPKKSFDVGLQAFAIVCQKMRNVFYVHIGRGGDVLKNLAESLGVADRFFTLGELPRDRVLKAYRGSDIFFSPASVEGFAIVNLEAMASGLPCVVTDAPGNRDSIVHGWNGYIVPVGSKNRMAEALIDLLSNDERRQAFSNASMKYVKQYEWTKVANKYIEAFQRLIQNYSLRREYKLS